MPADAWSLAATGLALAFAGALATLALRRRARPGAVAAVLTLVPLVLLLLKDDFRLFAFHGLMHAAFVERVVADGLPPGDPLFAGAALRYPWAHHVLVAALARGLGLAPPTAFAVLNLAAAAASAALLAALARRLGLGRGAAATGAVLALFGPSLLGGPVAWAVSELGGVTVERRTLAVAKFASPQSNGLGILGLLLVLYGLVRLLGGGRRRAPALAAVAGGTLATAFLYPLLAPVAGATAVGSVAVAALGRRLAPSLALAALGAVGLPAVLALPYLRAVGVGADAPARLGPTAASLGPAAVHLGFLAASVAVPVAFGWRTLARVWRERPFAWLPLALAALLGAAGWLLLRLPMGTEYKLLVVAGLAAGVPAGAGVDALASRRPVAALLLLAVLLLPAGDWFARQARNVFGDAAAVETAGGALRPTDPVRQRLYAWIRAHTPADAVFVDAGLEVPVFAGRRLLVGIDARGDGLPPPGWGMSIPLIETAVLGHAPASLRARERFARALLDPAAGPVPAPPPRLRRAIGGAPLYVVTRTPEAGRRLAAAPFARRRHADGPVAVWALGETAPQPPSR